MLKFRAKTIIGIALIEVALLVILVASALNFLGESNERQLIQRAHATTTMFSHAVTDAVISTDLATLDDLVREIMMLEGVVFAKVTGIDRVLATGGDLSLLEEAKLVGDKLELDSQVFKSIVVIKVEGTPYGFVELGFTTSEVLTMLSQAKRAIIGIASLEVLLVALFSFVLGTYLTRNLVRLRDAAQIVKTKGPGYQLNLKQSDELGEVASAFDSMSKSLAENYRELQQAREEAEHANQSKSRFLASMSHEIRTPMNGVLGLLTSLKQTPLNKQQQKLVDTARDSGNLLLSLINNILDFSRMEANNLITHREAFNLKHSTKTVLSSMQPLAQQSGITLTSQMDNVPDYVIGDKNHYKQILLNLVGNALKFTPQGSVNVRLSATQLSKTNFVLQCQVKDTGIGISDTDLPYLFHEFTMADQSFTRTHEGSGLGLAICKRLLDMMDGEIKVASREGQGSCFTFTIPLEIASEAEFQKQHQPPAALNPLCKQARVLIAEDNKANQMVIRTLFTHISPYVDIAENGVEALNMVQENQYDIVFMDISMPEMDGLTACKAIRNLDDPAKASLPIIAFTAHALTGDKEKFINSGMTDYLAKPVSLAKLIDKLNVHVGHESPSESALDSAPPEDVNQSTAPNHETTLIGNKDKNLLVDEQTLQQIIRDTSVETLPMLIDHYVKETQKHQEKITQAAESQQLDKLGFEVHKLSSSSLALGNNALSELARTIEVECHNNNHTEAYQLAAQLEELANRSMEALLLRKEQGFAEQS